MLGLSFNRLTAAEESTGFKSVSYAGNMSTYIFFIVVIIVGLCAFIVAFFIVLSCKSRVRVYMTNKVN